MDQNPRSVVPGYTPGFSFDHKNSARCSRWPRIALRWHKVALKWRKMALTWLKMALGWPKIAPKWPKMALRWLKMAPDGLRYTQNDPKHPKILRHPKYTNTKIIQLSNSSYCSDVIRMILLVAKKLTFLFG